MYYTVILNSFPVGVNRVLHGIVALTYSLSTLWLQLFETRRASLSKRYAI